MAGMGIDGLVSGLDTTSLINQLMQAEAMPQNLLRTKSTTTQTFLTALQGLNTKVASLAEAATKAATPASWTAFTATSTSTSTSATAGATAQAGSISFSVDSLATTQLSLSAADAADGSNLFPVAPPTVTIRTGEGTFVTVTPATGSLSDVARAINDAAESGVKATVVRVGEVDGEPQYRLQFAGSVTGAANTFEVWRGTEAEVVGGTAVRVDTNLVRPPTDAQVTLWKGTPLATASTSASNTFSDLMTGVDVTVSEVTAADDPAVTVSVSQDEAALTALASGLVGSLGVVLSEITSRTSTTTKTNTDGTTAVTGGLFSGDSAVRGINQQLMSAATQPVDGRSPSEVGIVLGRDGTFTFDEEKFAAALAADPTTVQSIVSTIADRVATAATSISDKYDGSLTLKITGQEGVVKDLGTQIESWDRRLELRREGLQRTYSALEVTLSNLQSQSSWLTSQLANLPTYS